MARTDNLELTLLLTSIKEDIAKIAAITSAIVFHVIIGIASRLMICLTLSSTSILSCKIMPDRIKLYIRVQLIINITIFHYR